MKANDMTKNASISLALQVEVSTGRTHEHTYILPNEQDEALKITKPVMRDIGTILRNEKGFLLLSNPYIIYSAKHIVCIEIIFRGPAEWAELMRKSTKPPLGFRVEEPDK